MTEHAYYLLTNKNCPIYKACDKFRKDTAQYKIDIENYLKPYHVDRFKLGFDGKPFSFLFEKDKTPVNFKQPDRRDGAVQPYVKNEVWREIIKNAPVQPSVDTYVGELINAPTSYKYKTDDEGEGWTRFGAYHFHQYQVGWYSKTSPIALVMADIQQELKDFIKSREEADDPVEITCGSDKWKVPEGLRQIMKEEWDLMVAKHEKLNNE